MEISIQTSLATWKLLFLLLNYPKSLSKHFKGGMCFDMASMRLKMGRPSMANVGFVYISISVNFDVCVAHQKCVVVSVVLPIFTFKLIGGI